MSRSVLTTLLFGVAIAAIMPARATAQDAASQFRNQCGVCHTLSDKDPPRIGPPLNGVYGRKAASVPGFRYSNGLANSGIVWDDAKLDAWLANPQSVAPASSMVYRVPNPATRQALIEYLKQLR